MIFGGYIARANLHNYHTMRFIHFFSYLAEFVACGPHQGTTVQLGKSRKRVHDLHKGTLSNVFSNWPLCHLCVVFVSGN